LEQHHQSVSVMRGRLLCFEQIVKALCESQGFTRVRLAVLEARHADETVTRAYDYFAAMGGSAFMQGMEMVVQDRVNKAAPGWLKAI